MAEYQDATYGPIDAFRGQIVRTKDGVSPPKNIITSVIGARGMYQKYRADHIKRIYLYSQIEGLIAGNAPYNQAELAKNGLGHIANFNPLDARSLYERGALAYWNLLNQAETLVKFTLVSAAPEAVRFAEIMSEEWDHVVRHWESFNTLMNMLAAQLVKLGVSPVFWPDERDWKWRVIELSKFFIPDQSQSDIAQLTSVAIETTFTAQYLFEVYDTFKDVPADESPWDIKEIENLLLKVANASAKNNYEITDFMEMQSRLQNGDLLYDVIFTDSIRLISFFQQEYDGKVSHYMFHRLIDNGSFLFFADRQYECMSQALTIFTASPGEFTIHSNRGLGHKIFSTSQAMMQLDCSIVDMARWSSTPLIRTPAAQTRDAEQIRFYPGVPTNIGSAEFIENRLGQNITQLVQASQYLLSKLQYNTANSGDDPGTPDRGKGQGSLSGDQAVMQSFREFGILKNNIAHFYFQFDFVIRNMIIKMLRSKKGYPGYESAQEWKERCIARGVPESVFEIPSDWPADKLPPHLKAKATRVAGDGSTVAKLLGTQILGPIVGTLGEKGRRSFQRQVIMAAMGPDYLEEFMPDESESDERSGGASLAGAENGLMTLGISPVFSLDNEHQAHMATHLALGVQTIQKLQQQQSNPVEADKIFAVLVPHMEEHLQALQQSMFAQQFLEQHGQAIDQVLEYARLNRKNASAMLQKQLRDQQQAEAQQQKVMSDIELKNMQAVNDEKRKDFKIQSQVERAKEANATRGEVMREKIQSDAANKRLQIALDNKNKMIETNAKVATQAKESDIREAIRNMNGQTPAPNDME